MKTAEGQELRPDLEQAITLLEEAEREINTDLPTVSVIIPRSIRLLREGRVDTAFSHVEDLQTMLSHEIEARKGALEKLSRVNEMLQPKSRE